MKARKKPTWHYIYSLEDCGRLKIESPRPLGSVETAEVNRKVMTIMAAEERGLAKKGAS